MIVVCSFLITTLDKQRDIQQDTKSISSMNNIIDFQYCISTVRTYI